MPDTNCSTSASARSLRSSHVALPRLCQPYEHLGVLHPRKDTDLAPKCSRNQFSDPHPPDPPCESEQKRRCARPSSASPEGSAWKTAPPDCKLQLEHRNEQERIGVQQLSPHWTHAGIAEAKAWEADDNKGPFPFYPMTLGHREQLLLGLTFCVGKPPH